MNDSPVLFLGKKDDPHVSKALEFCRLRFRSVTSRLGGWGDALPAELNAWSGGHIISYLSRWVLPAGLLARATSSALNFHPAPPEYPGIGCINFALYHDAREFGVTCHHMASSVDTGGIVAVRRFPILPQDTVSSLLTRSYDYQLVLFYDIITLIAEGRELPSCAEGWPRPPYKRKEFEELRRVTADMDRAEIERRIRATSFGPYQPTIEVSGFFFALREPRQA
jgi:methionyl-tRNA formyltransferase